MTAREGMMGVRGPGSWQACARWLDTVRIPVRLGVTSPAGPTVVSLWYLRDGETLWCATRRDAALVGYLEASPTVGFEVSTDAPPYRGVRGTANTVLDEARGPQVIDALVGRYLSEKNARLAGWLTDRRDTEVAIGVHISWLASWDFSPRMAPEDATWLVPPGASPSDVS